MPFLSRSEWDDYSSHGSPNSVGLPSKRKEKGLMTSLKKFILRKGRGESAAQLRPSPNTIRIQDSSNSMATGRANGQADGHEFAPTGGKAPPRSSASMPVLFPPAGPFGASSASFLPAPREPGSGRRVLPAPSSSAILQLPSIEACISPQSSGAMPDLPSTGSAPQGHQEASSQNCSSMNSVSPRLVQPDPDEPRQSSMSQPLPVLRIRQPLKTPPAAAALAPAGASPPPDTPLVLACPSPPTAPSPGPATPTPTTPQVANQTRPGTTTLLAVGAGTPDSMRRPVWSLMDYAVGARMYKGDVSSVYKAVCLHSNVKVALKVYSLNRVADNVLHTLVREVRIHTDLSHASVLMMYGVFEEESRLVLVLERAARGDLFHLHRSLPQCRMSEDQVRVLVLAPLLDALVYLHSRGVCHRDIKPENLLMTSGWQLRLADFGAAINLVQERAVTRTGTVNYMAPEVERCPLKAAPDDNKDNPNLAYTTAADVWSAGVLAYELMVGFPPFISCGQGSGDPDEAADVQSSMVELGGLGPHRACERERQRELSLPHFMSAGAQDFISLALSERPGDRPTAAQLLRHPWLKHAVRQHHLRQQQEQQQQGGVLQPGRQQQEQEQAQRQGHSGRLPGGGQRQLSQQELPTASRTARKAPSAVPSRPVEAFIVSQSPPA